jgi:membrane protein DedA with SNARE-associated domain
MSAVVTGLGPLGVFLLMVPESACIPVPSEVTLLAAGFAVHEGSMSFAVAVGAATAGNIVGSLIAYGLGRAASHRSPGAWARRGLALCDPLFSRHGARAVLVARLMPLARTFVSLPAGHARVGVARFVAMTILGCAAWAAAFVLAGMLLGADWRAVSGAIGVPLLALGVVILLAALRASRPSDPG